jgi:hypothetical protein
MEPMQKLPENMVLRGEVFGVRRHDAAFPRGGYDTAGYRHIASVSTFASFFLDTLVWPSAQRRRHRAAAFESGVVPPHSKKARDRSGDVLRCAF